MWFTKSIILSVGTKLLNRNFKDLISMENLKNTITFIFCLICLALFPRGNRDWYNMMMETSMWWLFFFTQSAIMELFSMSVSRLSNIIIAGVGLSCNRSLSFPEDPCLSILPNFPFRRIWDFAKSNHNSMWSSLFFYPPIVPNFLTNWTRNWCFSCLCFHTRPSWKVGRILLVLSLWKETWW